MHLSARGRCWRARALSMLVASLAVPVVIGILLYGGCRGACGGGLFFGGSYLYAILSSLLLLGFSRGVIQRGSGNPGAVTISVLWLLLGLPLLVFGLLSVIWHIYTREMDNVFFYSVAMVLPSLSGIVTFVGLWQLRARRTAGDPPFLGW